MGKRWIPLEANPDVLNDFAGKLGMDTSKLSFCDVYGLDEELLAMVPQPVYALLLLFPVTTEGDAAAAKEDQRLRAKGEEIDPSVFYMKQTVSNACGTTGVLHAVGNNLAAANIGQGSFFKQFYDATSGMSPEARGRYLEEPPEGAPSIDEAHAAAAQMGDTRPELDEDVTPHFVALVQHGGRLLELDGRKAFPIDHGPTTQDSLLKDSAVVARKFMDVTDSINFNLIALTAAQS